VRAVHVVDEELDDDGVVVGRAGGAWREQRDGAGAADGESPARGPDLGEVLAWTARRYPRDLLVEVGEAGDVAGDDADRDGR
jgi:hypothetical protein